MASKIVLFVLVVTICKVQSYTIYYPDPQSSTASSNAKASAASPPSSSNAKASSNTQASSPSSQSQSLKAQPSNPSNQGLKVSPQLQIVPGRKINLQAYPVSAIQNSQGSAQQGQNQNIGYSTPRYTQVSSSPQVQISPAQLIQPCLTGPASVITSPVSSNTIPPSTTTTVFDHSLCNSLANALQMMIANEFINSVINNNIIKESIDIPVVETVVPTFDLGKFLKGLNTQQIQQAPSQSEMPQVDAPQYDWAAIQNFLNKQEVKPVSEASAEPTDVSDYMSYCQHYGQTAEQINQQQPSSQCYSTLQVSHNQGPQAFPAQQSGYDSVLETLAAYFGCNVSDICSSTNPSVPQFAFPEEIPAQLICNYGYMPTVVPVVSFSVQPVSSGEDSNFIIGCKC